MQETLYTIQTNFASGEISPEVASRIDLDKYQGALLQAENAYIRPYGAAYKRGGTLYCGETKYPGKRVLLKEFNAPLGSFLLEIGDRYIRVWKNGTYTGVEVTTPFGTEEMDALRFCQSADVMFIASGKYPLMTLNRYADDHWTLEEYTIRKPYFDGALAYVKGLKITPSGTTGTVTLTASAPLFLPGMVGASVQLEHEIATKTVELTGGTSGAVRVGGTWKIHTNRTWYGKIYVDMSDDGTTWKEYRYYRSIGDANYTESGTVTEPKYMRVRIELESHDGNNVNVQFSALTYTHKGTARITGYTDSQHVTAEVIDPFGDTGATENYAISPWCSAYGYPKAVTFFQDRLCLAGTDKQPHMVWMSCSGDYPNFSVTKESGTITDDSAIALSFISRKRRDIKHIIPAGALVVLTDGNEWTVDGSSTVTPTKASTRMQTTRGVSDVEPISIGNQIIYVQKRGKTVRNFKYDYTTDSYDGEDLTLLVKHITRHAAIIDMDYMQDPDSCIYFVLSDGTMATLSYVFDQHVYAWTRLTTAGKFIDVCNVDGIDKDIVYVAVERDGKTCIEELFDMTESDDPDDYIMLDSASIITGDKISGGAVPHLAGQTIAVLGDGRYFPGIKTDQEGNFVIPAKVSHIIAGIPYTMTLETPNVEIQTQKGTAQGRQKKIAAATLRLVNSLGGYTGVTEGRLDQIKYDENMGQKIRLYSGDKRVTMPNPGTEKNGRVVIRSDAPYPFNLSALIREVVISAQ